MINPYRPVPSYPAPPAAPPPPPAPIARGPVGMTPDYGFPQPMPAPYPQPAPVKGHMVHWDPLGELAFSAVGTPIAALAGAAVGFLVAGPIGAARGALLAASIPGTLFAGHEFLFHNPWWGTPPRTGGVAIAALLGFPLLSAAGYGVGLAIAGAAGAAWGTMIAAALPIAVVMGGSMIARWLNPPVVYDPGPTPAPTDPPPRPRV